LGLDEAVEEDAVRDEVFVLMLLDWNEKSVHVEVRSGEVRWEVV
jgi:hypothetical protein